MLDSQLNRKNEAELLYRKALLVEKKHSFASYNLALLLESKIANKNNIIENKDIISNEIEDTKNKTQNESNLIIENEIENQIDIENQKCIEEKELQLEEIRNLYFSAMKYNEKDPIMTADYGRFLLHYLGDLTNSEIFLSKSLSLNEKCEPALFNMAILLEKYYFILK